MALQRCNLTRRRAIYLDITSYNTELWSIFGKVLAGGLFIKTSLQKGTNAKFSLNPTTTVSFCYLAGWLPHLRIAAADRFRSHDALKPPHRRHRHLLLLPRCPSPIRPPSLSLLSHRWLSVITSDVSTSKRTRIR